jgi:hypothetical protein
MVRVITLALLLGAVGSSACGANTSGGSVLTHNLSEPLNGAKSARVDINAGTGNLTIDRLTGDEQVLASGTLQYFEKQGPPTRSVSSDNGKATLTLKSGDTAQPLFRLPWEACNGETEWQIHLNPNVQSDITAYSSGGNVKLDLAGMAVKRLSADIGGGNMDVVLPDSAANLSVIAKTGAGNVTVDIGSGTTGGNTVNANSGAGNVVVRVPSGIAARFHATSGVGKTTVDTRFSIVDRNTYQSPDYDSAANKVEITANSGAGNVSVNTK